MTQPSLLNYQPPPELMMVSPLKVLADCEHLLQPRASVNSQALAWQEGQIAYYRKLMMQFMDLQRLDSEAGTATLQKQAMRRQMLSHLHELCEACLAKIQQLQGGTNANT